MDFCASFPKPTERVQDAQCGGPEMSKTSSSFAVGHSLHTEGVLATTPHTITLCKLRPFLITIIISIGSRQYWKLDVQTASCVKVCK